MQRRHGSLMILAFAIAACQDADTPSQPADARLQLPAAVEPGAPDAWLGRWQGPEGTYLELRETADGYDVEIRTLDGSSVYEGRAVDHGIAFERGGMVETIRATDGEATGMKWLLEKSNCLTIRTGEGFCRD